MCAVAFRTTQRQNRMRIIDTEGFVPVFVPWLVHHNGLPGA